MRAIILLISLALFSQCRQGESQIINKNMTYKQLTEEEKKVIIEKGTEKPFTGVYTDYFEPGIYECKQCGAELYNASSKFHSGCGWPSFDDEIPGAVKRIPDADGRRTEIICANCGGHLGHVFVGEGFTEKDTRHCVNSISLNFKPIENNLDTAIFAGGCFWGVEYYFSNLPGVKATEVGYIGGNKSNPTYEEVCSGTTGHLEAIRVVFDKEKTSYEDLAKLFFEIHDPTQTNGQGPDIGNQYLSAIFYNSDKQKEVSEKLIKILEEKGLDIATKLNPASKFWPAENYHQQYYDKKRGVPYCHAKTKRF
ncbi:MAG: bifunctional methionine sulfoxide reductase B/A protein [Bacteroidales bacterium]|nr:bifunctional methionine sulfoxide reductase B/A protein [Bacteroidales bacterium]